MTDISLLGSLVGHQNPIYSLEIDSDKNILYSAGNDKGIVEWNLDTMQFSRILCSVPSSVYCLKLIPDTDWIVAGLRNGQILVIERTNPQLIAKLQVEKGAIFSIQVLKNKQELVAVGEEGKVYIWSLDNFNLLYTFQLSQTALRVIAVDDNEKILAFGDKNGFVYLVNTVDYQTRASKQVHEQGVTSLSFLGESLISGGRDAMMHKLSSSNLEKKDTITPHMFTVYGIQKVNGHKYFSTVSRDKTLKIWNSNFKLQKNVSRDKKYDSHHLSINCQVFSANTRTLATAGDDKVIKVWNLIFQETD